MIPCLLCNTVVYVADRTFKREWYPRLEISHRSVRNEKTPIYDVHWKNWKTAKMRWENIRKDATTRWPSYGLFVRMDNALGECCLGNKMLPPDRHSGHTDICAECFEKIEKAFSGGEGGGEGGGTVFSVIVVRDGKGGNGVGILPYGKK